MRRRSFIAGAAGTALAGCLSLGEPDDMVHQSRLDAKNETIAELEDKLDEKEARIETLEDEIGVLMRDYEAELTTLESELADKRETLDTVSAEHERLEEEIEQLERTIREIEPESTFEDDTIDAAREVGADRRRGVIFAWTDREYGTAFEFRDRDYLSVEHGLDGTLTVLDGPGGETIDGDQFELTSEKTSYEYDLRYLAGEEGTEYPIDIRDHRTPEEDEPVIVIGHPNNVGYWAVSLGRYVETQQSSWRGTPI